METLIILVKLLCAHLCSDFILQTDRIKIGICISFYISYLRVKR